MPLFKQKKSANSNNGGSPKHPILCSPAMQPRFTLILLPSCLIVRIGGLSRFLFNQFVKIRHIIHCHTVLWIP